QRLVLAVVVRRRRRGVEEERQVDPRADEDDERVERHLAEQERPVVGEGVTERLADEGGAAGPLVDVADEAADHDALRLRTPHHDGPTGPEKLPAARSSPPLRTSSGSCGSGRPAGPKVTSPPRAGS